MCSRLKSSGYFPSAKPPLGFTLIELLVVIVILAIAAAVVVPQLGGSMQRTRLVVAARSIVQATRYARAMAIQHQAEVEININPASGDVEVRARTTGALADMLHALDSERKIEEEAHAKDDLDFSSNEIGVNTNVAADVGTAQSFAEEIKAKFKNQDVSFEFLGYTDNFDTDMQQTAEIVDTNHQSPFSLVFRSNGICRPFKVRALTQDGDYLDVTVDMIGKAKIEGYGDVD